MVEQAKKSKAEGNKYCICRHVRQAERFTRTEKLFKVNGKILALSETAESIFLCFMICKVPSFM